MWCIINRLFHYNPLFRCYFGNKKDVLNPKEYLVLSNVQDILSLSPFSSIKKMMNLQKLIFLRQTHSADGLLVDNPNLAYTQTSFSQEGDYLITNQKNIGLGVMTADCLPLIIADMVHGAIGIAHAGWRGTVASIGPTMFVEMQKTFGTQPEHVKVLLGPSAKVCCYKVSQSFVQELENIPHYDQLIIKRNNHYYFDATLCNRMLLEDTGIPKDVFCVDYNVCTICDSTFYSHRRGNTGRQMTVVNLV